MVKLQRLQQSVAACLLWCVMLPLVAAAGEWQIQNEKAGYYPGEPVWMRYSMLSEHRFAKLVLAQDANLEPNSVLQTYTAEAVIDSQSGKTLYRHRLDWLSAGRRSGDISLHTPKLEFIVGGKIQQTIASQTLKIKRLDLPDYLPPSVLIGDFDFAYDKTHLREQKRLGLLATHRLYSVKLNLQSRHALPTHLPDPAALIDFPPGFSVVKTLQARTIKFAEDHFTSHVNTTVYFTLKHSGHIVIDEQRLNRFDPATGKMTFDTFAMPQLITLPAWSITLFVGALGLTLLIVAILLLLSSILVIQSIGVYARHWHRLRHSTTPTTALNNLRQLGGLLGWPFAIGIQQWQGQWSTHLGVQPNEELRLSLRQLEASYYGTTAWQENYWREGLSTFPHRLWLIHLLVRAVYRAWCYLTFRSR